MEGPPPGVPPNACPTTSLLPPPLLTTPTVAPASRQPATTVAQPIPPRTIGVLKRCRALRLRNMFPRSPGGPTLTIARPAHWCNPRTRAIRQGSKAPSPPGVAHPCVCGNTPPRASYLHTRGLLLRSCGGATHERHGNITEEGRHRARLGKRCKSDAPTRLRKRGMRTCRCRPRQNSNMNTTTCTNATIKAPNTKVGPSGRTKHPHQRPRMPKASCKQPKRQVAPVRPRANPPLRLGDTRRHQRLRSG